MARPVGRPHKKVDEKLLVDLARIHCSYEEMAHILECDIDTLRNNFSEVIEKSKSEGKMGLRRRQFKSAIEEGNPTMSIWLGRQYLNQSEKVEVFAKLDQVDKSEELIEKLKRALDARLK